MENTEKSVVAIAHMNEKHRSPERVLQVVREAIDLLGGMKKFVWERGRISNTSGGKLTK